MGMETHLEEVVFCVLEDHNSAKWHPRGNVEPFREAFGKGLRGPRHPAPGESKPPGGPNQGRRRGRARKHEAGNWVGWQNQWQSEGSAGGRAA
eukprot:10275475-Alexandrium_andersonii.AAC.1